MYYSIPITRIGIKIIYNIYYDVYNQVCLNEILASQVCKFSSNPNLSPPLPFLRRCGVKYYFNIFMNIIIKQTLS